jgi:conjugative relaxase-like TrwC/TraI family protein
MLRVTAGHDVEYPLRGAGTAVGYYLQDGNEPPGVWAGKAAEAMGLTGLVDPEAYRNLFGKLIAPTGERLYSGRPPRYAADSAGKDEEAAAAVAALDEFATPAEQRRTRAKVLGSTGAAVPFYDLTFSATKSVSLLQVSFAANAAKARERGDAAAADEFEAKVRAIDDAARETAAQVVALAEERALFVRTGHHSAHTGEFRDGAGAVAALFVQHDNRNGEPNLHVHMVVLNRAQRADQDASGDRKWRAAYGQAIWAESLGLGAAAERIFARKLALLGIPLRQQEDGNAFEVGGVDQATMDAFSTRTRGQIDPAFAAEEAAYKREHGKEPSARQRWEWRQHLARSTRKAKQKDAPAGAERLAAWEEHSRRANVQVLSDLHQAVAEYGACHAPAAELTQAQAERTVRIAVAEVQARHAVFSASQLLWELHRALPPLPAGTDPLPVLEELAADALTGQVEGVDVVLVSPAPGRLDVDHLGVRASDGQSIYTVPCRLRYATAGQLDTEQHILTTAAAPRPQLVHPEHAEAAAATAQDAGQLSGDQAAALAALLSCGQAVTVVRAAAGTGKTRLVGTFAKEWTEAAGGAVHTVTVSENAARVAATEMEAAGATVRAANLARFLGKRPDGTPGRPADVGPRDVIVLDEASQVSTADWLHLAGLAARTGARIIAVGDEYQLGAIGAGGMFTLLAERHGAVELHEVHRFANEWEKQASLALRDGDAGVIADYQAQGRVFAAPEDKAMRNVVLDWAADIGAGRDALIIAQTEAQVTELNRQAAEHLARKREAAGHNPGPERITLADGNTAQSGDWIQARLNEHMISADGQWLANRDILQVDRIYGYGEHRQVEARRRLPNGTWSKPFTVPAAYAGHSATLGYAVTIYAAQGRTADVGHGLVTPGMNREALYVLSTRGRLENRLHVVTGQAGSPSQSAPEAVLGQALATRASEQAATTAMDAALDAADHPARLIYLYQQITASQRATDLDTAFAARLTPGDYARYHADPARPALHQVIREAQLAGHDTAAIVNAITRGPMTGARSVAAALHGRVKKLNLPQRPPPAAWTSQLPEAHADGPARAAAEAMDERTRAIGEQLAEHPEHWVLDRLGVPPDRPGPLREDWTVRAGQAGYARQAADITDPDTAIGPRPEGDPEKAAAWDHAAAALNLRAEEHDMRAASRAQLEHQVRAYTQAAEAAPPDMGRQVDRHRTLAAELIRQAEQAQAEHRHQDAADSRAAAAEHDAQADATATAQHARTWWERDHQPQRQTARDARDELHRRGIQPEPEPRQPDAQAAEETLTTGQEAGSLAAWWQQLDTPDPRGGHVDPERHAQIKAEQTASIQASRDEAAAWWQQFENAAQNTAAALATERENTIAAGQPRPPGPGVPTAPEPGAPAPSGAGGQVPHEAGYETTLQWWQQLDTPDPGAGHVDPAWHARIRAEQTARVQADKAARREASARAYPVTDAEIALYGTHRHDPATPAAGREPLLAAPTGHDDPDAHETPGQYHARMQSYAQWQPETHPEANVEPAREAQADTLGHGEIEL